MTDTLKLRAAILQSGLNRERVAKELSISVHTLHKKIHNITEFKASEIAILTDILEITDKESIFFVNTVELKSTKKGDESYESLIVKSTQNFRA